jgi:hypothetical protein
MSGVKSKLFTAAKNRLTRMEESYGGPVSLGVAYFTSSLPVRDERRFLHALQVAPPHPFMQ